ncbi:glycosyltransferase family 2 protein [Cutibacterium sp. WCA-380-WT-3A]|uniref:Glycosyltransferase family 2 protein n=1 Tax=Cutibacterium porci TaxID=2605781 RepID=A0A7K0J7L7_9ACTN|nr:glycosyltransferase family 2 protein [Cutibacterium porci]MSS45955.1 glycosyltransferase family 2 protein [Cutibacterium porci]
MSDEKYSAQTGSGESRQSDRGDAPRTAEGLTDWTIPVIPSVQVDPEDWAWAHERRTPVDPDITADQVATILLVHQAAEWLPRTLSALRRSQERAAVQIAVDLGSTDGSSTLLTDAVGEGLLEECVTARADTAPGEGIKLAIDRLPDDVTHIWILHDDAEVRRDSLTCMLREASRKPHPDVLYPTLLKPARHNYPEFIDELGQSVSTSGARILPVVDLGDIDQKQADPGPILGGSTAGMFIRLDGWRRLGGFDPALPLFRDGVDFGWRANEAGMVVRTAPSCTIHHRQAGRGWQRESHLAPRPDVTDRLAGMRMVAARTGHPIRSSLAFLLASVWRFLVLLIGKAPSRAADEWRAGWQLWRSRSVTREMTRRLRDFHAQCDPDDLENTNRLIPSRRSVWARAVDRYAGDLSDRIHPWRNEDGATIDDLTGDDFTVRDHRSVVNPYTVMVSLLAVVGLVACRGLYGPGKATSTWLAPAPDGLAGAWHRWLTAVPGTSGANAPWLAWPALGSVLTIGQPEVLVRILLVVAPLLAAMSAHRLFRRVVGLGATAVLLATFWGLLPVLTGGLARGSVTALALGVILPHMALHTWRLLNPETVDVAELRGAGRGRRPVGNVSSAGGVAVWSALAMSLVPALWIYPVLVAVGVLMSRPRRVLLGAIVALGPLLVIAPWIPRLISDPGRLATGAEPLLSPAIETRAGLWLLVGRAIVPGTAPTAFAMVAMVPLWIAALWAVWRLVIDRSASTGSLTGHPRGCVLALIMVYLVCLALAGVASRTVITVWGEQVHPAIEPWQLLGVGVLLLLVAAARQSALLKGAEADHLPADESPTLGQLLVSMGNRWLPGVLAISVAASGVWWLVGGARGPMSTTDALRPAYVTAVENSARHTRTLMVNVQGADAQWNLVDSDTPSWGSGERPTISSDSRIADPTADLALAVATGAVPDDLADRLAGLGIGHLWLRGAGADVVSQVGNAAGLTAANTDPTTTVWTVDGNPSRSLLSRGGDDVPVAGKVSQSGTLTILEPRDDRWKVEVGGTQLSPAPHRGIGQSYRVGSARGDLTWSMPTQGWACASELIAFLVLMVLAGPQATQRGRTAAPRRSAPATPRRHQEES